MSALIPRRRREPSTEDRLETAKALHAACAEAVDVEEDRGRALDQKLNQTASFAGVVLALVGATGGTLVGSTDMALEWRIATGSTLVLSSVLLLIGIIWSFVAVAPKAYLGIDENAVVAMTVPAALDRSPEDTYGELAATQREILLTARAVNERKASSSGRATLLVMTGMGFVVVTLLLRTLEGIISGAPNIG